MGRDRLRTAFARWGAATLLSGAALLGAPAAHGTEAADASSGAVTHVQTTDEGVQAIVSVPADADVDLVAATVTIGGEEATAEAVRAGSSTRVRRTTVLAIDTSNSMKGDRFVSAKQAALTYLAEVPEDVNVGIVSFAGDVEVELPPTTDRDAARDVISALSLTRETRLYDGVLAAADLVGTTGQRSVLVLSDGADTSSTPLEDVTAAVTESGALVDVVALEQSGSALDALARLATAGGGKVISAERTALSEAFSAEADVLARQVLVTAEVPAAVTAKQASLEVTLPSASGGEPVVAEVFTTVQDEAREAVVPTPRVVDRGWTAPTWMMLAGVAALGVGLLAVAVLLVPARPAPMTAADRVSSYAALDPRTAAAEAATKPDAEAALNQAKDAAASVLQRNKGLEVRISDRLEQAGSELKAAEWLLVHAGIFSVSGLLGLLVGGGSVITGLLFLALGALLPWLYLGRKRSRRRKAFEALLPETLQLMSGSLAAGLSLAQSVDTIVREGSDPVASEFRRVLVETRLGVSLEDAFESVAVRFDSKDFGWVVMAIKIQRQVGGNLAELFDTVAATMREREYMRRQVAALAAEGKLSAWVLGGLPPLFMLYLLLTNGDYVKPMFHDPVGWLMLGGACLLLGVGVFWMSRLIKVEV